MLKFESISKKPYFPDTSFEFSGGVMCLVTDKKETEKLFFKLITGENIPDNGYLKNNFKNYSICIGKLPDELTVKDYLKFVCKCKKCSSLPEKSQELTEYIIDDRIKNLNEYECLTVSVAAALIGNPELILICTSDYELEPYDTRKLGELIDSLREFSSIIFSSDIPSLFGAHSDKLLVISEGKTVGFGDSEEILAQSEKDGGLYARIKGDIDAASGYLKEAYTLEPSDKQGIFTVRCTDSEDARKEIRFAVRKLGMALLELKADNDALKNMFKALEKAEDDAVASEVYSDGDGEYNESDEQVSDEINLSEAQSSDTKTAHTPLKPKITVSFAHNDDDEEDE